LIVGVLAETSISSTTASTINTETTTSSKQAEEVESLNALNAHTQAVEAAADAQMIIPQSSTTTQSRVPYLLVYHIVEVDAGADDEAKRPDHVPGDTEMRDQEGVGARLGRFRRDSGVVGKRLGHIGVSSMKAKLGDRKRRRAAAGGATAVGTQQQGEKAVKALNEDEDEYISDSPLSTDAVGF